MRSAAIINPHSGGGRTIKVWRQIGEHLTRRLDGLQIFFTEKSGHATELAEEVAKSGFDRLIVVGGDGTLHECVNGFIKDGKPLYKPGFTMGILNGGRGCDFTKTLNIPDDPEKMVEICVNGKIKPSDLGRVDLDSKTVYYINSSTFGLGGEVAKSLQTGSKLLPPVASYLTATVKGVLQAHPKKLSVEVDGRSIYQGLAQNIFVCNGRYSGGGMLWAPEARLDDGLLDVLVVGNLSRIQLMTLAPRIYTGTLSSVQGVVSLTGKTVRIKSDHNVWIELDGETYQSRTASYSALPQVLNLLY